MVTPICLADATFGPVVTESCRAFDFTIVFEATILSILPSFLLLIVVLYQLWRNRPLHLRPISHLRLATILVLGILVLLHALLLALDWALPLNNDATVRSITLAADALSIVTTLAAIVLVCSRDRPHDSLSLYFFFSILCNATRTRTAWLIDGGCQAVSTTNLIIVLFDILALILLGVRRPLVSRGEAPEERCGIWERVLLVYLVPLLRRGFKEKLTVDKLPQLDSRMANDRIMKEFHMTWQNAQQTRTNALLFAAFRASLSSYLLPCIPRLCLSAARLSQPLLLQATINFLNDKSATISVGYGLIGAYALVYIGYALATSLYWTLTYRFIAIMRGKLIGIVYDKTLSVNLSCKSSFSPMTLMGTDVQKVVLSFQQIHEVWASVLEICLAIWLLQRQMGAAAAVPGIICFFSTIGSAYISGCAVSAQRSWLDAIEVRVDASSSFLIGLTPLRLTGMTKKIQRMIRVLRENEIKVSRRYRKLLVCTIMLGNGPELLSPVATFVTFVVIAQISRSQELQTAQAFTSLALITLLTFPLNVLVQAGPQLLSALGCFTRIQAFLNSDDGITDSVNVSTRTSSMGSQHDWDMSIEKEKFISAVKSIFNIYDGAFGWSTSSPIVSNVNLTILEKSFTVIVGAVGSGKTTLLEALLGNAIICNGLVERPHGTIAYCSQNPWILNDSVEANILIDRVKNLRRYTETLAMCGVDGVLNALPAGDKTIVGSKGTALSGGQRQKIALARAVYSGASVLILDDIFVGLDAESESLILEQLFSPAGYFRRAGITVVLATHSAKILALADQILEVLSTGLVSSRTVPQIGRSEKCIEPILHECKEDESEVSSSTVSEYSSDQMIEVVAPAYVAGRARTGLYKYYGHAAGPVACAVFGSTIFIAAFCEYFPSVWIQQYTSHSSYQSTGVLLSVYIALIAIGMITLFLALWAVLITMTSNSGRSLHEDIMESISNAYLPTLQKQDTGVLLNRLTQDMELVDMGLPLATMNAGTVQVGLVVASSHYLAATLPLFGVAIYILQWAYLRTSRQLRILELEAKAPLYTHFSETIDGNASIRSYGWQEHFRQKCWSLVDRSQRPFYLLYCVQFWLNLVLNLMVASLAVLLVGIVVATRDRVNAGFVGLALTTIMAFNQSLTSLLKYWTLLETSIGAVERVKDFKETTRQEDDTGRNNMILPPKNWPSHGKLEIESLQASYEPQSDLVIRGVDLRIQSGSHVALCGVSGSGKSSLLLALLRVIHRHAGQIRIDNVDISTIPLDLLRSSLNVIPQNPYLSAHTLRQNLVPDPAVSRTLDDDEIAHVLSEVGLWSDINARGGLDVQYEPMNYSAGEKQLLCLARTILKRGKLLLLDEATGSVDRETVSNVFRVIREHFTGSTVLAILHQLEHLHAFDYVAVMDHGVIIEYGRPQDLLATEDSALRRLYDTHLKNS